MNQNLEGSLFSTLRREPFDKAVSDARQSGLGWVVFAEWHYTFMMYTIQGARAQLARAAEGWGFSGRVAALWLGDTVTKTEEGRASGGRKGSQVPFEGTLWDVSLCCWVLWQWGFLVGEWWVCVCMCVFVTHMHAYSLAGNFKVLSTY